MNIYSQEMPIPPAEYDRYMEVRQNIDKGDYEKAYLKLKPYFKGTTTPHPYGYDLYSHILLRTQREKEAVPVLKNGIKNYPKRISLIQNLGISYLRTGQFKKAGERFFEAYKVGEKEKFGLGFTAAIAFFRGKEIKKAEKISLELIENHPEKRQSHLLLGKIYISSKQYQKAEKSLKNATKKFPGNSKLWKLLAVTYYKEKKLKETAAAYKIAHEISPSLSRSREREKLAKLFFYLGAANLGENSMGPGRKINHKEKDEILDSIAYMHAISGNLEKALISARKAEEISPTPERVFRTGQILFKMKKYRDAEEKLSDPILKKGKYRDKSLKLRSFMAWQQEDWNKTIELLKTSKTLEKNSKNLLEVLGFLVNEN